VIFSGLDALGVKNKIRWAKALFYAGRRREALSIVHDIEVDDDELEGIRTQDDEVVPLESNNTAHIREINSKLPFYRPASSQIMEYHPFGTGLGHTARAAQNEAVPPTVPGGAAKHLAVLAGRRAVSACSAESRSGACAIQNLKGGCEKWI
jgi:hypothetical protein